MSISPQIINNLIQVKRWLVKHRLIPYFEGEYVSSLSKEQIQIKLQLELEYMEKFHFSYRRRSNKDYEGLVKDDKFQFRRILKFGRNSFIPIVRGKLYSTSNKTKISIKVQLHTIINIFLLLFILSQAFLILVDFVSFDQTPAISSETFDKKSLELMLQQESTQKLFEAKEYIFPWNRLYMILIPFIIATVWFNFELSLIKDALKGMMNITEN